MNAAEPPVVLVNKLVEDGKDLRFSIEVHGVFLQRFECAKFPFDIQDLSVKVGVSEHRGKGSIFGSPAE